jgi:hypothetical protein
MGKKMTVKTATAKTATAADTRSLKDQALDWILEHKCVFHSNYKKYMGISTWQDMDADRFEVTSTGIIVYRSLVTSDYLAFDEKSIFTLRSMVTGKIPTLRIYMVDGTPRSMTGDQDIFVDGFGALFDASQKTAVTPKPKAGFESIVARFAYKPLPDSIRSLIPDDLWDAKTPEKRLAACIKEWQATCSRPLVVHKWIICECLLHTVCQPRALDPKVLLSFIPPEWYVKAGGSSSYGIGELITQMANGAFCNFLPSVQKSRPSDFHFTPIRHLVSCVCVIDVRETSSSLDSIEYWLSATDTDVTARRSSGSGGSSSTPRTPKLSLDQILGLLD